MNAFVIKNKATGEFLKITAQGNGDDARNCGSHTAQFSTSSGVDAIYCVTERGIAERALNSDLPWYNSTLELPQRPYGKFDPEEWEVVRLVDPAGS